MAIKPRKEWYQSKLVRGLIVSAVGFIVTKLQFGLDDASIVELVGYILEAIGVVYAGWGQRDSQQAPKPPKGTYA